jgi:hypothetical protein
MGGRVLGGNGRVSTRGKGRENRVKNGTSASVCSNNNPVGHGTKQITSVRYDFVTGFVGVGTFALSANRRVWMEFTSNALRPPNYAERRVFAQAARMLLSGRLF